MTKNRIKAKVATYMNVRILPPIRREQDWRNLVRDPSNQWKDGYSAKELAKRWLDADVFPLNVQTVLDAGLGTHVGMLLGIPEYKVDLPGGPTASQTDLMVLARTDTDLVVVAVEGKVDEPFGDLVADWLKLGGGRAPRLDYLRRTLGLGQVNLDSIRYQLLHRTASALIVAQQFLAQKAVMLVHSFSDKNTSFSDFTQFCSLWKVTPQVGTVMLVANLGRVELYLGWVKG